MAELPSWTAAELADRLGASLEGDGSLVIRGVAPLDEADAATISWVGSPDYADRVAASKALVLLASEGCDVPEGRTVIRVPDPDLAICDVLTWLAPPVDRVPVGVHPTATVHPEATVEEASVGAYVYVGAGSVVGSATQLHPGVYVGSGSRIGRDCVLWPGVVVRERITLGDRVIIHPNSTIGADGYGYLQRDGKHIKIPQIGTVEIEDDVEIGANSSIDRARSGVTRIGRGTKIDNQVQIGHNVQLGEGCIIIANCAIGGSATLGRFVMLGAQVAVRDHVRIGDGVQVAALSGVTRDISAGEIIRGVPAVQRTAYARQQVALKKLPGLLREVRELRRRPADPEA